MKLTKASFQEWLDGFHPRTKVGIGDETPVDRFFTLNGVERKGDLPKWAVKHSTMVKSRGTNSICAMAALSILENV